MTKRNRCGVNSRSRVPRSRSGFGKRLVGMEGGGASSRDASALVNSNTENTTGIFKNLPVETLLKMKDYLEHDRTPSKMKPAGLASMMPPIAEMEDVRGKLNTAIDDAKALTVAFFQKTCGDGNDGVRMAKVVRMIETRIGVLEELAKSAPAVANRCSSRCPDAHINSFSDAVVAKWNVKTTYPSRETAHPIYGWKECTVLLKQFGMTGISVYHTPEILLAEYETKHKEATNHSMSTTSKTREIWMI